MTLHTNVDPEELGRIATTLTQRGYASLPKAAMAMGMHVQTLRQYIEQGYVRAIKVGARNYVTFDEIKRYKDEGNLDRSKRPQTDVELQETEAASEYD